MDDFTFQQFRFLDFLICILFSLISPVAGKPKISFFPSMQLKETQDLEADSKEMEVKRVHSRMICQSHAKWRQEPTQERV